MIPAATVLRREDAVLVVVDIQERLAAAMSRREQVIARSGLLIRVAPIVGMPVLVTRQYPKGLGDLEPDLITALDQSASDGAVIEHVDKVHFDCFAESSFCDALLATGRKQMLLVGMETHICVTQTALAGLSEGMDVHVAGDACCSRSDEHHHLALQRLSHAGAVVTSSESAAYELVGCAGTDEFRALLSVVKGS